MGNQKPYDTFVKSDSDYSTPDPESVSISDAESRSLWESATPIPTQQKQPEPELEPLSDEDEARLEKARCLVAELMPLEFDASKPPPPDDPVLSLGGVVVGSPGNLVILSGQAKSGKSRCGVGGILSASICGSALGWSVRNPRNHAVIHLDSEQGASHWDGLNRSVMRRAGVAGFPDHVKSWRMTGFEPHRLRDSFGELLFWSKRRFGGTRIAILDNLTDMLMDVNSIVESVNLRIFLHALAQDYNCLIVGVLHSNQSSESSKARGHVGSECERKAESILPFYRDGEIVSTYTSLPRNEPILKGKGPKWRWSNDSHDFELVDPATIPPPGPSAVFSDTLNALRKGPERMTYSQAVQCISDGCKISTKAAQARLDRGHQQGFISKLEGGFYSIIENSEL